LTKIDVFANASTSTVKGSVKYGYDTLGRRNGVSNETSIGTPSYSKTIDYLLSDGDQIGEILGATGQVTNRFMYGPGVDMVLSEQQFAGGVAQSPQYQLTDHLGTVRGVAQRVGGASSATLVNAVQYDAFGKVTSQRNATNQPHHGFAGRDIEPVGGLTYNRNRYYSTSSGRFISQDPIGFNAGDENLYRYVGNKPTTHTDPSGLQESANGPSTQSPTIKVNVINSGTGQPFSVTLPNPYYQGGQGAYPPILSLPPLLNETEQQQLERRMQQSAQDKADWRAAMAEVNQRLQLVTLVGSVLSGKPRRPSNAIVSGSQRPSVTIKPSAPVKTVGDTILEGRCMITYWPPNRGFDGPPTTTTLPAGARIDRYGYDGGTFVSPQGVPSPKRALAPGTTDKPCSVFEVVNPLEVKAGKIAPWFNQPGGGMQYELGKSIKELLECGAIRRVTP
jgi:RHS repeat-associated protein